VIKKLAFRYNYKNRYSIVDLKMHMEDKIECKNYILMKYTTPKCNGMQCIKPTPQGYVFKCRSNF